MSETKKAQGTESALREQALARAPQALETVAAIMASERATNGDRIRAALAILDRACGKADGGAKTPEQGALEDIREELRRLGEAQP